MVFMDCWTPSFVRFSANMEINNFLGNQADMKQIQHTLVILKLEAVNLEPGVLICVTVSEG